MKLRFGFPIIPAEKTEKMTAIEMINCDFADSRLFIHESLVNLHCQLETLTWDDKHKEDPTLPNDLCDSMLYPTRFSRHYWGKLPLPKLSDTELLQMQERDMFNSVLIQYKEKQDDTGNVDDLFGSPKEVWSSPCADW